MNLLRLAMDQKIPRNEFIKFYIGNEINPNLKKFLSKRNIYFIPEGGANNFGITGSSEMVGSFDHTFDTICPVSYTHLTQPTNREV